MDVVGIVCEYDPFHRGHKRQFALIRERHPQAKLVCLMSGCFTQRGMPALYAPRSRAQAALAAGADLVLELPCAYAVRDAEHFALGGVSILNGLGFVDALSFGAEDDVRLLTPAAELLENPDESYLSALRRELDTGASHPSAQGRALTQRLPQCADALAKPNNILALCYLRALRRLGSSMAPLAVHREGNYHTDQLTGEGYPSASAVRKAILTGDRVAAEAACGYVPPLSPMCRPDGLDQALLYKLRGMSAERLRTLPLCGEGLENRLAAAAKSAASREELLAALKTKRYPRARLSRLCCHALLDMDQALLSRYPLPPYVRLLGFRRSSEGLLRLLRQSRLPVVAKAADGALTHPLYQLDIRAYDLWALGAGLPAGLMLRAGVAVAEEQSAGV